MVETKQRIRLASKEESNTHQYTWRNLDGVIASRESALGDVSASKQNLNRATELLRNDISRLYQMKGIYANDSACLRANPITEG